MKPSQLVFDFGTDLDKGDKKPSLHVFSTSRGVREFVKSQKDGIVLKSMSVVDFFTRAVICPNKRRADESERLLVMKQACELSQAQKIYIPNNFYEFLNDSEYIFSFFSELASFKKRPEDIRYADIYASFEEHIDILSDIFANYENLMAKRGLFDSITQPFDYIINEPFVKGFSEIVFEIDGFLSDFDYEVLNKVACNVDVKVCFSVSKFNQKLTSRFSGLTSQKLENGGFYELSLKGSKDGFFAKECRLLGRTRANRTILTRGFYIESLQAAFIFEKISKFIFEGIDAKDIAVILPDEGFASVLRLYDGVCTPGRMLSFGMGISFTSSRFYIALLAMLEAASENALVSLSQDYFTQAKSIDELSVRLNFLGVDEELYSHFCDKFNKTMDYNSFYEFILVLIERFGEEETVLLEVGAMRLLVQNESLNLKELCHLLLSRLSQKSIDDVGGGAVRVLGLLESRGLKFKAVVIPSFNDDVVPKRSVNEQFLSSSVRAKAGLVSYADRENLQRFYYERLIAEANEVAICYLKTAQKLPSRFLKYFNAIEDCAYSDDEYLALFGNSNSQKFPDTVGQYSSIKPIEHDFFANELSFSRLDTFLSCPRRYYYRYCANLKEARAVDQAPASAYGSALHELLYEYYKVPKNADKFDIEEFNKLIFKSDLSLLEKHILSLQAKRYEQEIARAHFEQGWLVLACEKSLSGEFDGVRIKGVVDRIDTRDNEKFIVDYKSGAANNSSLQLPFYAALLLASKMVKDESLIQGAYHSFSKMQTVGFRTDLKEGLDELKESLKFAREYFNSPDFKPAPRDKNICKYCAFRAICKGEI